MRNDDYLLTVPRWKQVFVFYRLEQFRKLIRNDDYLLTMPKWKQVLILAFAVVMPVMGSIHSIAW